VFLSWKVDVDGTYSPIESPFAPSQSPASGVAPPAPNENVRSAGPDVFEFRGLNVPLTVLHTPTVSTPSSFQSPAMARIAAPPAPNENVRSAAPELFEFRRTNPPVDG